MTKMRWLVMGAVALIASLAVACGDDDGSPSSSGDTGPGTVSSGMIAPNTFMTYEGQRYELVNMLFEDMVKDSEFSEAG